MPTIEITEDQHEYLDALRDDIQQDVVGKYAHVRMVDAVQYLIDNHEGEINATVTAPSAGPEVSAENTPAVDPADEPAEDADDSAEDSDGAAEDSEDGDDAGADEDAADDESETDEEEADADEAADEDDEEADSGGASSPPMAAAASGGDDGMLSAMMALMDTHDDKWESAAGDTGYEVELPDGSTESANTQDDVRALLFKHYE
ncbi:hypothetical protein GCM10028857_01080 [Salinarchaeum chitinilyticum]